MNGDSKRQAIIDALDALELKHGRLTPDLVVKEAAKKTSPMHGEFEWDDKKAAHRFRIEQARGLIQSFTLHVDRENAIIVSPRWVRDPDAGTNEQGYRSVASLATDRARARDALCSEAGRAAAYLQRVRNLSAGLDMEHELDEILERFEVFRQRVQAMQSAA